MAKEDVSIILVVMTDQDHARSKFQKQLRVIARKKDCVICVPSADLNIDQLGLSRIYGRSLAVENNYIRIIVVEPKKA